MDKNIDLIINSKFIGSQQTHRKKTYIIWISKIPLYWESREREMKPSSYYYGPVGLQRTTHASSERHQWTWWTPPWWCLDWIWCFWNLRRLELIFSSTPLGFLEYWGIYRAKRRCGRPPRWAQPTEAPIGVVPPSGHPQVQLGLIRFLLVQKKAL